MVIIIDELISNCLDIDDDLETPNKWDSLYYDKETDSYYKIRSYEARFVYKSIQNELVGTSYYLNAILDLDYCFPQFKRSRYHLYKLSKKPSDITIITYRGDWNKGLKQVLNIPKFNRFS